RPAHAHAPAGAAPRSPSARWGRPAGPSRPGWTPTAPPLPRAPGEGRGEEGGGRGEGGRGRRGRSGRRRRGRGGEAGGGRREAGGGRREAAPGAPVRAGPRVAPEPRSRRCALPARPARPARPAPRCALPPARRVPAQRPPGPPPSGSALRVRPQREPRREPRRSRRGAAAAARGSQQVRRRRVPGAAGGAAGAGEAGEPRPGPARPDPTSTSTRPGPARPGPAAERWLAAARVALAAGASGAAGPGNMRRAWVLLALGLAACAAAARAELTSDKDMYLDNSSVEEASGVYPIDDDDYASASGSGADEDGESPEPTASRPLPNAGPTSAVPAAEATTLKTRGKEPAQTESPEEIGEDKVRLSDSERKVDPSDEDANVYTEKHSDNLFKRTEVLAAVIAGGVIGFLFAIFLILLLVYRMRKKDEGSYDLGERKPSSAAYQKAPTKEFYA
uniref:Syndecan n=1 Tax=Canis lupus familiaris TaxID=9615 RepID=A0A8I3P1S4_CANLF